MLILCRITRLNLTINYVTLLQAQEELRPNMVTSSQSSLRSNMSTTSTNTLSGGSSIFGAGPRTPVTSDSQTSVGGSQVNTTRPLIGDSSSQAKMAQSSSFTLKPSKIEAGSSQASLGDHSSSSTSACSIVIRLNSGERIPAPDMAPLDQGNLLNVLLLNMQNYLLMKTII